MAITISNIFGRTLTVENDGIGTIQDALNQYYPSGCPKGLKVQLGGKDVTNFSTPVRDGDVILIREGEFARKPSVSGA